MTQPTYKIRRIDKNDLLGILAFTDLWIGQGYFSEPELSKLINLSQGTSFLAYSASEPYETLGVRLSITCGQIEMLGLKDLSLEKWPTPAREMAYFKSLFVAGPAQGQGIGMALSFASIAALQEKGAKAIACHSWLESPQDSSRKYLQKMGFQEVRHHKKFWYDVDYVCTRCGVGKCICTAVEMVKVL